MPLQLLSTAKRTGATRVDRMGGREYLVVPMVMITEGVHEGNNGPLYYPREELAKNPVVWNHKPIVVYHPDGSACSPEVIDSRGVGLIMNTRFKPGRGTTPGKLHAEAWLEAERVAEIDQRVLEAIEADTPMEVSTGLFTDNEGPAGSWSGKEYNAIARNHRPDHLAILPDMAGACSLADGAGLLVANHGHVARNHLVENAASFGNITRQLGQQLREQYGTASSPMIDLWIEDVYDDFCVFAMDGGLWRLGYKVENDQVQLAEGEADEVKRVTEYRTVEGAFVGNAAGLNPNPTELVPMTKNQKVSHLIGNGRWAEADRGFLMAANDAQLDRLIANAKDTGNGGGEGGSKPAGGEETGANNPPKDPAPKPGEPAPSVDRSSTRDTTGPTVDTNPTPAAKPNLDKDGNPVQNGAPVPVSAEQYVANAPPEIRQFLVHGLQTHNAQRQELIANIKGHPANMFSDPQLAAMPTESLVALAAIARPQPVANAGWGADPWASPLFQPVPGGVLPQGNDPWARVHAMQQPSYAGAAAPVANAGYGGGPEPLAIPTMNFEASKN